MKNRKREIRTSGSVRDEAGQPPSSTRRLGSAAAWPMALRAQQPSRMRTLALLSGGLENDQNNRGWLSAFDAALQSLNWVEGQNIRIERRYAPGDFNRMREHARELVDLKPDLVLTTNTPSAMAILQATHQIPLLFVNVTIRLEVGLYLACPTREATRLGSPTLNFRWVGNGCKY
jgi:hypothetical protein